MKTELSPLCETMTPPGRTGRIASILCRTAVTSLSLLTLFLHGQVQSAKALPPGQPIHIAALLPTNFGRFPFAIQNVKPAVDIAVKNVTGSGGRLEGREIRIHFRDSECSSAAAMNQMFEYYINKQVHVFFGPCCDYAAAPVGRQMHYWKLPMITAGAIARDFALSKSSLYDLMTRVGASVNSLVDFLLEIMHEFGWSRIKQVYDPYGQSIVGDKVCHIISDGIHYGLQDQNVVPNLEQDYEKFESVDEMLDKLAVEIGDWAALDVNMAVLLPFDDSYMFSYRRVAPAIEKAISYLNINTPLLRRHRLHVRYNDTKCNIAVGMDRAINFFIRREVHVFLGPVCDFSLAPVARQAGFWNIPTISGGAMARDFVIFRNTTYTMLTRVGPVSFGSLSTLLASMFHYNRWRRMKLLYYKDGIKGQDYLMKGFCHLSTEFVVYDLKEREPNLHVDYYRLEENNNLGNVLKEEVGFDFAGTVQLLIDLHSF